MSVELPEAMILGKQLSRELPGKQVLFCTPRDYEKLQKIGFMNRDLGDYDRLLEGTVESVVSRGNTVHIKLDNGMNLLIGPEYGGRVLYHSDPVASPDKFHIRVDFTDGTALTVRLTSMGVIQAVDDEGLGDSYLYKRDFSDKVSPVDEEFTFERFTKLITERGQQLKQVLVGKNAVLVGISNSTFQDVIYRADLHPKRKASELSGDESHALYDSIVKLIEERLRLGGKEKFTDIYGGSGAYTPVMDSNMKGQDCSKCGTLIEKLSVGGGQVYYCPKCQTL
jgi:formamidopyrimidine-DNA glycosylase